MKELIEIQKELKAPKSQFNSFGKYHYRTCEDILEAVKPIINKSNCILLLTDSIEEIGSRYYVKATAKLINNEGKEVETYAYARESEEKKGMDQSQITGATSSYARKYALNGLFCIDDTKDSDNYNNVDNNTEPKTQKAHIGGQPFTKSDPNLPYLNKYKSLEDKKEGKYSAEWKDTVIKIANKDTNLLKLRTKYKVTKESASLLEEDVMNYLIKQNK